jgi:stage V sporulation protein B
LGLAVFASPVLSLIFKGQEESIRIAAPLLSLLGGSVFLSCMITATNAVLHAYRSVKLPILALVAGVSVKLLGAFVLIGNSEIGLMGAPISSFLCNATIVFLNYCFASAYSKKLSVRKIFVIPLINGAVSVGFSYLSYLHFAQTRGESALLTTVFLFAAIGLYFLLSALSGSFSQKELCMLPCFNTVIGGFERLKSTFFKENKQKNEK